LHTLQEDRAFFREPLFNTSELWGAFDDAGMIGIIAFRAGSVDQLYVLPTSQRRGVGSALLRVAQGRFPRLSLWTFQRNVTARRFYERRGFVLIEESDGARNDEKEPDALYVWVRGKPDDAASA
jgi:GNAT superfamily N-acetyltransferase